MHIVFARKGTRLDEVPEILYCGNDRAESRRIANESDCPRVTVADYPTEYPVHNYSDERAAAYAAAHPDERGPDADKADENKPSRKRK